MFSCYLIVLIVQPFYGFHFTHENDLISDSVRRKLGSGRQINFGFFWVKLETFGRVWAKPGGVKGVFGQRQGCE
jgi:hypothetical protein